MNTIGKRVLRIALLLSFYVFAAGAQAPGQLPRTPKGAPKVGEKAPGFTLPDTNGKPVRLSELAKPASSSDAQDGQWALLVFYRGYW